MRLLFFSTVYPGVDDPARGVYNAALVEALAVENDVRVVAPRPWIRGWLRRSSGAPPPATPPVPTRRPLFLYPPGVLQRHHDAFLWLSSRRAVSGVLRSFQPDAVLSYWTHPDGAVAARVAARAGARAVPIVGGSDALLLARRPDRRDGIVRVLKEADAVLAVGSHLRQSVVDLGVPAERVHLLRRGVDERFRPGDRLAARRKLDLPPERRTLLFVGSLVPVKSVDTLLAAARGLVEEGVDLQVCIAGDGPLRSTLERLSLERPLAGRVRWAGVVEHRALPDWYRAADLTVLPSLSEGTPNVLLESVACGTPFVATRVGSVPEMTPHPDDDLVPPGDSAALLEAIRRRLAEPRTAPAASAFRWSDSAAMVTRVLEDLQPEAR